MAHDSSLPPGSILLRTMPLIVPRYGGALLFMAVHARCSDRSSVLSLFSPPPFLSLSLSLPVCSSSCTFEIVELKKEEWKRKEWRNQNGFFDRSRRRLPEQMLSQFIFDDAKSSHRSRSCIGNRSTIFLSRCTKIGCWLGRPISIGIWKKKKEEKLEQRTNHRRTI